MGINKKQIISKYKCLACSFRFNLKSKSRCPRCWSTKLRDDKEDFKKIKKKPKK